MKKSKKEEGKSAKKTTKKGCKGGKEGTIADKHFMWYKKVMTDRANRAGRGPKKTLKVLLLDFLFLPFPLLPQTSFCTEKAPVIKTSLAYHSHHEGEMLFLSSLY